MIRPSLHVLAVASLGAFAVGCSSSSASGTFAGGASDGDAELCALPDDAKNVGLEIYGATMTSRGGDTALYLMVDKGTFDFAVRKYHLTSASPCTFARDEAFGEKPVKGGALAADDAGNVYVAGIDGVARIAPGTPVTCSGNDESTSFSSPPGFAMRPDGSVGIVAERRRDQPSRLFRVAPDGTGCRVAPFTTTGAPLTDVAHVALDAAGRLHLGQDPEGTGDGGVLVFDADGAYVSSYGTGRDDVKTVASLTACKTGICLDAFSAYVALDADGHVLASKRLHEPFPAGITGSSFVSVVGAPDAPAVFAAGEGSGSGSAKAVLVYRLPGI